jgi:hypothetical protein
VIGLKRLGSPHPGLERRRRERLEQGARERRLDR